MKERVIRIGKHPYAFDIKVQFGSFEQMLENATDKCHWDGYQIALGGDFNRRIEKQCGKRATFLEIGLQLELKESREPITLENVEKAFAICQCRWEGVYWKCTYFDEEIKQGLFPVTADWDGKTYIERGKFDENHRWQSWYEQTDTFRF